MIGCERIPRSEFSQLLPPVLGHGQDPDGSGQVGHGTFWLRLRHTARCYKANGKISLESSIGHASKRRAKCS